mmetsp:Transcript_10845/g.19614  ORF Transcript_10845/g.19614 Transcript_10845/m.19614 type:complete len:122 (-) Transcript_10845:39-404(-)
MSENLEFLSSNWSSVDDNDRDCQLESVRTRRWMNGVWLRTEREREHPTEEEVNTRGMIEIGDKVMKKIGLDESSILKESYTTIEMNWKKVLIKFFIRIYRSIQRYVDRSRVRCGILVLIEK